VVQVRVDPDTQFAPDVAEVVNPLIRVAVLEFPTSFMLDIFVPSVNVSAELEVSNNPPMVTVLVNVFSPLKV
jgi:hypothetical protein